MQSEPEPPTELLQLTTCHEVSWCNCGPGGDVCALLSGSKPSAHRKPDTRALDAPRIAAA